MANLIDRMRQQDAIYWSPLGNDGFGNKTYNAPVQLRVRWEKKREMVRDKNGQEVISQAIVYPPTELDLDGFLFEGLLIDFDSTVDTADPLSIKGAFEIIQIATTPKLHRNKKQNRRLEHAWL